MSRTRGNGGDQERPDEVAPTEPASDEAGETAAETSLQEIPPTRAELEALRRERDELKDTALRRRADLENFRKRAEREQQAAATEAAAGVLRRLVETVDNLERALASESGEEALRRGVELTLRDFLAALESQGVTAIQPQGQPFDPEQHQALLHEPVPGFDRGIVAQVLRSGYRYRDRLLRPALVKVASGAPEPEPDPVDAGGGGEVQ